MVQNNGLTAEAVARIRVGLDVLRDQLTAEIAQGEQDFDTTDWDIAGSEAMDLKRDHPCLRRIIAMIDAIKESPTAESGIAEAGGGDSRQS